MITYSSHFVSHFTSEQDCSKIVSTLSNVMLIKISSGNAVLQRQKTVSSCYFKNTCAQFTDDKVAFFPALVTVNPKDQFLLDLFSVINSTRGPLTRPLRSLIFSC